MPNNSKGLTDEIISKESKSSCSKNSRECLMSNNSKQPSDEMRSKASKSKAGSYRASMASGSRPSMKLLRNSTIAAFLAKNLPRPKSRSTTPRFGPEIKPTIKSFDTKEDADDCSRDTHELLKDAMAYLDDEDNTLSESAHGTAGHQSYEDESGRICLADQCTESMPGSRDENSTFHAEDKEDESDDHTKTKETVVYDNIIIHQPGQPSTFSVSPEDIIIKVEASTVSFRDCLLRRGLGVDKVSFPFVPGCEVIGTVYSAGKAAQHAGYHVGDRIVGMSRNGGGNAHYAKFNTRNVASLISSSIDAADAVCLVDVYMTAYQALRLGKADDGAPLTDANVLIIDGYSPVGQAAVALATLEGANVYVTTTDSHQDDYMKTLGAECLPYAPSEWLRKIEGKMDIVIDNACFDSYDSSWKALGPNGILVCTGMISIYSFRDVNAGGGCGGYGAFGEMCDYRAKWAAIKARYMMSQTRFHDLWESFQNDPAKYQQEMMCLCCLVESGSLKPKIAERVSIGEVPDAQRYLEMGKANGTIVCLP